MKYLMTYKIFESTVGIFKEITKEEYEKVVRDLDAEEFSQSDKKSIQKILSSNYPNLEDVMGKVLFVSPNCTTFHSIPYEHAARGKVKRLDIKLGDIYHNHFFHITKMEDEWFYVFAVKKEFDQRRAEIARNDPSWMWVERYYYYKCDQIEGLVEFIKKKYENHKNI